MPSRQLKKILTWDVSDVPPFVEWNRLKSLRKNRRLNIAQFCEKLKISTATYFYLEAGVDTGSEKLKKKVADFFGCEISDVFPVLMIGSITKEEWQKDGSWIGLLEIPAGLKGEFIDKMNSKTKGEAEIKLIEN